MKTHPRRFGLRRSAGGRLVAPLMLAVLAIGLAGCRSAPASIEQSERRPGERSAHALAYHPGLGRVLLVGGVPADLDGGVWALDRRRWRRLGSDHGPGSRGHFALAFDAEREELLLHGGLALRSRGGAGVEARHGDLWAWSSNAGWTLRHDALAGPGVRDHHAMAWDPTRRVMVLFGGARGAPGAQQLLADTWTWDGSAWRFAAQEGPSPRSTHRLVADEQRGRLVLFGGYGEGGLLGDTWEWDGASWSLVSSSGPSPRFATRMAWDAARSRVVLFGGRSGTGDLGDTWEWDGATWSQVADDGPPPRNVHALAYDPERRRTVLYGGLSAGRRLGDTWSWDGRRWRVAVGVAPPPCCAHASGE